MLRRSSLSLAILASLNVGQVAAQQQDAETQVKPSEVIVITGSPLDKTALNSAQPVSVLSGDELRQSQAHTLGETLATEPGINNTHFANVAGSPIIRGLDGPRVKITQNGLDAGDQSRGSPDHAVTTETTTAQQVEVFRGPATLLYGSGAIGGVVNVVDNRIPEQALDGVRGNYSVGANSAANQKEGSFSADAGNGPVVFHVDAFARDADDYEVPTFTNDEGETNDKVENTYIESQGLNLGGSYIGDRGFIGFSFGRMTQEYGIPGHEHAHEHEEEEHDHEEEHAHEHGEAGPFVDLEQNRYQLAGALNNPFAGFDKVELRAAYTDYTHSEIEGGVAASTFANEQTEVRITARHQPLLGWRGAVGLQWSDSDQTSHGEEAFAPDSTTESTGIFWVLEREYAGFNWEVGARYEQVDIDTDELGDFSYNPVSFSAGFTRPLTKQLSMSLNFSHAERPVSATELLANGAHLATRTYELGALYELEEVAPEHYHVERREGKPELEKSNNIDLGFHLEQGDFHGQINFFYNNVDDFIYERFTGVDSADLHIEDHDHHEEEAGGEHEHDHEHDHGGALNVVQFTQADVELYGYEIEAAWQLDRNWTVSGFSDYTRAKLKDGGNLPRIPSQRIGADVSYQAQAWDAKVGYIYYAEQERIAANETPTDSYGLLNAQVSFYPQALARNNMTLYVKAENITDELGFVHSSFLKDDAPVTGRNFSIGLRGEF
ncbi:TonB-dependent receptor [Idiomarina xiamenensis]|uniref:TonB-dependent receptor n=1 Tax=Idiomarina xiamenensis 10-D-4 TaxID=740709 RepID=K2KN16_9GAMM|nr:TonB-dependent receptor [Idiomarina xiamenensis]EKE83854.1 hypothetical protein A10D4_06901 [Idiomarina xiamenensis 10-D-4]